VDGGRSALGELRTVTNRALIETSLVSTSKEGQSVSVEAIGNRK